uniref:Ribosomal protein L20 n=1 Tax=Juncus effusus TaxID=13579 RepID=A0A8A3SPG8_JUNEF|nr:ribosomal protein L20 [Juncus effusus]QSZ78317.1 ribosomal protein L20 [Juncus effusus]
MLEFHEDIFLGDAEEKTVLVYQAFEAPIQDILEQLINRKFELWFLLIKIEAGKRGIFVVCGSLEFMQFFVKIRYFLIIVNLYIICTIKNFFFIVRYFRKFRYPIGLVLTIFVIRLSNKIKK